MEKVNSQLAPEDRDKLKRMIYNLGGAIRRHADAEVSVKLTECNVVFRGKDAGAALPFRQEHEKATRKMMEAALDTLYNYIESITIGEE